MILLFAHEMGHVFVPEEVLTKTFPFIFQLVKKHYFDTYDVNHLIWIMTSLG